MDANEMTTAELMQYVMAHSATGDPDNSLADWLANGDLTGMTADEVAHEWDADRE